MAQSKNRRQTGAKRDRERAVELKRTLKRERKQGRGLEPETGLEAEPDTEGETGLATELETEPQTELVQKQAPDEQS